MELYKLSGPFALQKALDFLMPYVLEKETWPYSQISPISAHVTAGRFVLSCCCKLSENGGCLHEIF